MPSTLKNSRLLEAKQVTPMLQRMALQIVEQNMDEKEIYFAGIADLGLDIASMLMEEVRKWSNISCELLAIHMDKKNPLRPDIQGIERVANQVVIVVDDVADTGRTMMYALKPFLSYRLKKLEIAVLIDREHKNFPLVSNYIGYQISTTVKEHIQVVKSHEGIEAYIE